jgi:hypothetical protein
MTTETTNRLDKFRTMIPLVRLYDLVSLVGAIVLLLTWIMQQTYLQETTSRLSELNSYKVAAAILEPNSLMLKALEDIKPEFPF